MLQAVVVNYKTSADLSGFLGAWDQYAPGWCDLTIVNVDPDEADIKVAKNHPAPYIQHDENVGYSYACNHAVVDSKADVLAFFNADTRLLPGTIEPLYTNLMANEAWGVIGPRQVDDSGRLTHAGIVGKPTRPILRGWMQRDTPAFTDIVEDAVSVMGSAYFIKKACWDQLAGCAIYREMHPDALGAFLPTKHYYEETWASYHARSHGWKVVYYGLSKMIHRWHKASPIGGAADRLFGESQTMFRAMCDKHGIARD